MLIVSSPSHQGRVDARSAAGWGLTNAEIVSPPASHSFGTLPSGEGGRAELRGEGIAQEFKQIVEDYVVRRFGGGQAAAE